jgi:predicted small secreted protein
MKSPARETAPGFQFEGGGNPEVAAVSAQSYRPGVRISSDSNAEILMTRFAVAMAITSVLALSSCANTANGLAKDGRDASKALDASTHRVLKAGAN